MRRMAIEGPGEGQGGFGELPHPELKRNQLGRDLWRRRIDFHRPFHRKKGFRLLVRPLRNSSDPEEKSDIGGSHPPRPAQVLERAFVVSPSLGKPGQRDEGVGRVPVERKCAICSTQRPIVIAVEVECEGHH